MTNSESTVLPASATYPIREDIKRVGAKFAMNVWTVTASQLAALRASAVESCRASNKRDRAFGLAWAAVEQDLDGGAEWESLLAAADAASAAYAAKY